MNQSVLNAFCSSLYWLVLPAGTKCQTLVPTSNTNQYKPKSYRRTQHQTWAAASSVAHMECEAPAAEGRVGDEAAPTQASAARDEARRVVGQDVVEDLLGKLVWQRHARAWRRHAGVRLEPSRGSKSLVGSERPNQEEEATTTCFEVNKETFRQV